MTKAQILEAVKATLQEHNASEELTLELVQLLSPKRGEGSLGNSPLTDDSGNITHYWCRLHERYEVVEDMIISNGKSKGQCKAGLSAWTRNNSAIKKLEGEATQALMDGDFETAQAKALEVKEAKAVLNESSNYDYDTDWAIYNENKAAKTGDTEAPKKKK